MAVNKVVVNDETVVDLTSDTVTSDVLLASYTAHDSSGNVITGILSDNLDPVLNSLTVLTIDYTLTETQYNELIALCS